MIEILTVEGWLLDHENAGLGGRRVVAIPRPENKLLVDGQYVSLVADVWTAADGHFELVCIKASGTVYTIQTRPERRLPENIELRCDDWPAGAVIPLGDLPVVIPPGVVPGTTVEELMAELQGYIDAALPPPLWGIPFSDVRNALTVGQGEMGYPNATGRALRIRAVRLDAQIVPTGAGILVDVRKNGVTIFTDPAHRPAIPAGGTHGSSSAVDEHDFLPDDVMTIDVDQIGSAVAGGHLTVTVVVEG